jgi:hypothetical protein
MGVYIACLDLALGIADPALGLGGERLGPQCKEGSLIVIGAAAVTAYLIHGPNARTLA